MRFDIVSDTHGHLSEELLAELRGADYIVHAGDICSDSDYRRLMRIAPVHMCLGNNDWGIDYGPEVKRVTRFFAAGLRWQICHYEERLDLATCDIAICGHTHRPFFERDPKTRTLVMNPGSPTFPRTAKGPTIGRIIAENGYVSEVHIIQLKRR
ncbi:MAG: metallophosphoesterase family protein [Atopobiaceae bacterium]|nr:metallophosphoesterase family protein [Atopobiaceae bacterium]